MLETGTRRHIYRSPAVLPQKFYSYRDTPLHVLSRIPSRGGDFFFLDFLVVIRYQRCGFDGILPRPRGVSRLVRKVQPSTPFGHEIVSNARHGARAQKGKCHVVTSTISVPDEALRSSLVIELHSHSHSQELCAFPKSAYRRSTVQVSAQELSMPKVCSKRAAKCQ